MRISTFAILGVFLFAPAAFANGHPGQDGKPTCNWGEVTSESIADSSGLLQGQHASDPFDDGLGPLSEDQPREGLPNFGDEQGNLEAICVILDPS